MTDIKTIIAKINKQFGNNTLGYAKDLDFIDIPRITSGSLFLDWALGQDARAGKTGWPLGRIVELYGPESAGKSLISIKTIAHAQKQGLVCLYIDCENSFDEEFAKNLGVDISKLILSRESQGEKVVDMASELLKEKAVDVIVFDSVAAMIPKIEVDDPLEQIQMAPMARMMSMPVTYHANDPKMSRSAWPT